MFGSSVYCLSVTLLIGSLWFTESYGEMSMDEKALFEAAKNKKWGEMLELVKDMDVNVDFEHDENGISLLSYTVQYSDANVVEELIKLGADKLVDKQIVRGSKVYIAEWTKMAKYLVNKTLEYHHYIGKYNYDVIITRCPVYYAVVKGDKDIFDVLVKYGANPRKDETLLFHTTQTCHKELARILIDKPYLFNVNKADVSDPEKYRIEAENCPIAYDDYYRKTPLHLAANFNCNQEFMKIFVSKHANVNANGYGETPLHTAARLGRDIAVKALIQLGADLKIEDSNGRTPLQLAEKEGFDGTAKILKAGKESSIGKLLRGVKGQHAKTEPVQQQTPKGSNP